MPNLLYVGIEKTNSCTSTNDAVCDCICSFINCSFPPINCFGFLACSSIWTWLWARRGRLPPALYFFNVFLVCWNSRVFMFFLPFVRPAFPAAVPCYSLARTLNGFQWNLTEVITTANRLNDYIGAKLEQGQGRKIRQKIRIDVSWCFAAMSDFRRDVRLCPFVYRTFLLAMATRIRQTITTAGAEASYFRERFLTLCLNIVLSQLIFFVRIWNISLLFLYLLLLLFLLLLMSSSSSFSVTYYYYKCLRSTLHSPFRHWPAGFWRP